MTHFECVDAANTVCCVLCRWHKVINCMSAVANTRLALMLLCSLFALMMALCVCIAGPCCIIGLSACFEHLCCLGEWLWIIIISLLVCLSAWRSRGSSSSSWHAASVSAWCVPSVVCAESYKAQVACWIRSLADLLLCCCSQRMLHLCHHRHSGSCNKCRSACAFWGWLCKQLCRQASEAISCPGIAGLVLSSCPDMWMCCGGSIISLLQHGWLVSTATGVDCLWMVLGLCSGVGSSRDASGVCSR